MRELDEVDGMIYAYHSGAWPLDRGDMYRLKDRRQELEEELACCAAP